MWALRTAPASASLVKVVWSIVSVVMVELPFPCEIA
jgi:hypothetical protein